jgi:hypothetical protein
VGVRYWRIVWTQRGSDQEMTSLFPDGTYLEEIAPRLTTDWTQDGIRALP